MFEQDSRYEDVETASLEDENGEKISYKKRRFFPNTEKQIVYKQISMIDGDRLDLIAARMYGDSEQFWRICDANKIMDPFYSHSGSGEKLKITFPQFSGENNQ